MAATASQVVHGPVLDVERVRREFPILDRTVNGRPLVYLDSGASSQRPVAVLRAVEEYETRSHANIHRGVHALSQAATEAFEGARERVRRYINARSTKEIIFVRGTTEAINLVAQSFARPRFKAGDEIIVTALEHHANIVPWQMVCEQTGCTLKVAPINKRGELLFDEYVKLLSPRTKLVAIAHVSNALGTILPVKRMGCDFYAFSGHKLYGPTGIGVLYGREELLQSMPPWQGGGDMILTVSFEKTTYNDLPAKFEAGTPNISGAVGLAAAMDYVESLGLDAIAAHEHRLVELATAELQKIPGIQIIGTATHKASIVSFTLDGVHPHDLGTILDHEGVAVRTGHHCAMPLMTFLGLPATVRASFAVYNTEKDVASLIAALGKAREVFG
jgi:cysteine desulfurase/selenocysteine lyase